MFRANAKLAVNAPKDGRRISQKQGNVPKVGYFRDSPDEFKIKSLYSNDLILNIASKSKETVQKLKFLDSPLSSTDIQGCTSVERYTDVRF